MEKVIAGSLKRHGYRMENIIGTGAFGRVYLISRMPQGSLFACKSAVGPKAQNMLKREAELLGQMRHPLFARMETYWQEKELACLIMEYIGGQNLSHYLKSGAVSLSQVHRIAVQLAGGICFLHQLPNPILYRDMKPDNIRVEPGGRVRLLDLGCACFLSDAAKSKAGTAGFAPGEQLRDGRVGFYSDIYGFGKVLEYMLEKVSFRERWLPNKKTEYDKWKLLVNKCTAVDLETRLQNMACVLKSIQNRGQNFVYERFEKEM